MPRGCRPSVSVPATLMFSRAKVAVTASETTASNSSTCDLREPSGSIAIYLFVRMLGFIIA